MIAHCKFCRHTYTAAEFAALPLVGVMTDSDRDGFGLELRNCYCTKEPATISAYRCNVCGYVVDEDDVDCECEGEMLVDEFEKGEVAVA